MINQEDIEVDQFEMKKAHYPDILRSGGLGPCIAIGVYDPNTRSGYMMHEPHFQYAKLDEKIQKILRDYKDASRLKIFVAGNSLSSHDDNTQRGFEMSNRPHVERCMKKYFQDSQVRIQWVPDDHCAELYLDTSTGKFTLDAPSLEELLE